MAGKSHDDVILPKTTRRFKYKVVWMFLMVDIYLSLIFIGSMGLPEEDRGDK